MNKLVANNLYVIPYIERGRYKKGGKREILSLYKLAIFRKKQKLTCQLHGDIYAAAFVFRVKDINQKVRSVPIIIDCEDTESSYKNTETEIFKQIKVYDPERHGKCKQSFDALFNAPDLMLEAENQELKHNKAID